MITVLSGFAAGSLHVLSGPDHLAALAPMAAADHGKATALGFRWGLGHGLGAAGLGLLAILGRGLIHVEDWSAGAEAIVGIALVGLGLWSWHTTTHSAPVAAAGHTHPARRRILDHVDRLAEALDRCQERPVVHAHVSGCTQPMTHRRKPHRRHRHSWPERSGR